MKPLFEKIERSFESSFTIKKFDQQNLNARPQWHIHPEYEIVFISQGCKGRRHIGNHVSSFDNGDLIFLGPNIPHYGFTDQFKADHFEIVVQVNKDFLGHSFFDAPELKNIQLLFERSKSGISFFGNIKNEVGKDLLKMTSMNSFDRLLSLLNVFQKLTTSEEYRLLNVQGQTLEVNSKDHQRMEAVYNYVSNHYLTSISLEDIAKVIQMTVPSFCRYFKQMTGKTFTLFVNEFRVAHACNLLTDTDKSITEICFDSGFNNMSHFNKLFRSITDQTPGSYRKNGKLIITGELKNNIIFHK